MKNFFLSLVLSITFFPPISASHADMLRKLEQDTMFYHALTITAVKIHLTPIDLPSGCMIVVPDTNLTFQNVLPDDANTIIKTILDDLIQIPILTNGRSCYRPEISITHLEQNLSFLAKAFNKAVKVGGTVPSASSPLTLATLKGLIKSEQTNTDTKNLLHQIGLHVARLTNPEAIDFRQKIEFEDFAQWFNEYRV